MQAQGAGAVRGQAKSQQERHYSRFNGYACRTLNPYPRTYYIPYQKHYTLLLTPYDMRYTFICGSRLLLTLPFTARPPWPAAASQRLARDVHNWHVSFITHNLIHCGLWVVALEEGGGLVAPPGNTCVRPLQSVTARYTSAEVDSNIISQPCPLPFGKVPHIIPPTE